MSTILQNLFVKDWLLKRVKKIQMATIAQFNTGSAQESRSEPDPKYGMASIITNHDQPTRDIIL